MAHFKGHILGHNIWWGIAYFWLIQEPKCPTVCELQKIEFGDAQKQNLLRKNMKLFVRIFF